jgi:3',5'-cyclic AMP phosphodiesterase CpdA
MFVAHEVVVVGLNSVRPWRQQGGALDDGPLEEAMRRIREAPAGALRVVALHHHLAAPPWRAARKRPLRRRDDVLRALLVGGVDLVASGHVHQGAVADRREFMAIEEGSRRSIVLATAPGLGRPRPQRKEEARGLNVYEADADELVLRTYAWDGLVFEEIGRRTFLRG